MLHKESFKTIQLALPIAFGELAQMSLHLIDAALVGMLSYKHLAASALVMSVVNIPFILAIGLTIAVSQLVSLAHGQKNNQAVAQYLYNGFILCLIFGILISLLLVFGVDILDHLKQDPEVVALAKPFMKLISWSIIPMIIFMTLKQFTDGLEYTKTAMILSILAVPINAILAWALIFGHFGLPQLALVGAGYATLITRIIIAVILMYVIYFHNIYKPYISLAKKSWHLSLNAWKSLLKIGIPSSLQITMEAGAFAISGIIIGTIGVREQAAHQIALSLASFTFMISLGLSQAGSIRTSNALGENNWQKIRNIGTSALRIAIIYGIICMIIYILFREQLPLLFNKDQDVIVLAAGLLLWAAIFQISDSTQAVAAGLLRGIKDVQIPTYLIAIAYWIIGIPIGYFLAKNTTLGASGIWIGFIIGLTVSSIFLSLRFLKLSKYRK